MPGSYPPPPYPPPRYPPPPPGAGTGTDGLAIAALVLGILGIFLFPFAVLAVLALIFGILGLRRARRHGRQGAGLAIAGIVLAAAGLVLFVGMIFVVQSGLLDAEEVPWAELEGGEIDLQTREVAEVVSCRLPHRSEVYAVVSDRGLFPAEYPDPPGLVEQAGAVCEQRYPVYVGVPYKDSEFLSRAVVPSQRQWDAGARWFVCLVEREDGGDLLALVKSSFR